jgi:hypothetical protein
MRTWLQCPFGNCVRHAWWDPLNPRIPPGAPRPVLLHTSTHSEWFNLTENVRRWPFNPDRVVVRRNC